MAVADGPGGREMPVVATVVDGLGGRETPVVVMSQRGERD